MKTLTRLGAFAVAVAALLLALAGCGNSGTAEQMTISGATVKLTGSGLTDGGAYLVFMCDKGGDTPKAVISALRQDGVLQDAKGNKGVPGTGMQAALSNGVEIRIAYTLPAGTDTASLRFKFSGYERALANL